MSRGHTPTDEQRTKVTAIVAKGTDSSTAALASVDVLFTDDEMAYQKRSSIKKKPDRKAANRQAH